MSKRELEEAVKELKKGIEHPTAGFMPDLQRAERLGIEALQRLQQLRHYSDLNIRDLTLKPLPSETEEEQQ